MNSSFICKGKLLLCCAMIGLTSHLLHAGGFQVNMMSIRQIGMAHLGLGLKLGSGSIYFNPGALALMETKYSFSGGLSAIMASTAFRHQETNTASETSNPLGTPFNIYAAIKLNDRISAGIGAYTPFGSSVNWSNDWQGKFLIQNVALKAIFVQPTLAYKLHEKFSVGVGLIYAYGSVDLSRALPVGSSTSEGQVHLSGTTSNWGFNAGIFSQLTSKWSIGFTYKSKINMDLKNGNAEFSVPASLSSGFPAGNTFNTSIPLPASINGGIGFQTSNKLLIGLDVNLIQWSAYDSLNFDFKINTAQLVDSKNARKYKDAAIVRLGAQYHLSEQLTIRSGAYYDITPVQDNYLNPETPDANRLGLSAGISIVPVKNLSIDVSFLYINAMKRSATYAPQNFAGTYKTVAYVPGIGVSYGF